MKAFTGSVNIRKKQDAAMVVAPTKKRALEILNAAGERITMHSFNLYWMERPLQSSDASTPEDEGLYLSNGMNYPQNFQIYHPHKGQ